MISAVWRAGNLGKLSLFEGREGSPWPDRAWEVLPPSESKVEQGGARIVWIAMPVQTTLLDDTRMECSGREAATQHSHSLPFMPY